jgi:mannose-6-phosphate isomerase-like protein (cupin superfamily)
MNIAPKIAQSALANNAKRTYPWMGIEFSFPLGTDGGSGPVGVVEATVPAGSGPPIHVHTNEDEIFYLLEGTYEFYLNGEIFIREAGDCVFLPRGVPHTFRVIGKTPGRNLTVMTPGGFEKFFVEVSERALAIPQDMAEVKKVAAAYGLQFVGPPLSARQ